MDLRARIAGVVFATCLLTTGRAHGLDVSGTVSVNAQWSDTVRLTADVTVANGVTVTVEPGTVVIAQGKYRLIVSGRIVAAGVPGDSIRFQAASTGTGWYGLRFQSTAASNDSSLLLHCILQDGKADGNGGDGTGGVLLVEGFSKLRASNSSFRTNMARYGGAIYLASQADITISDCEFRNNQAPGTSSNGLGGAIYVTNASPRIAGCALRDNTAITGGAICLRTSAAQVLGNKVTDNRATGIMSQNYHGGGIYVQQSTALIEGNTVAYNTAQRDGGGIYLVSSPQARVLRNIICNNGARDGGGVFCQDGATVLVSNVIANNNAGTYGGGVCLRNAASTILNATIANNMAEEGAGVAALEGSDAEVRNGILWGNRATWGGNQGLVSSSSPAVSFCAVESGQTEFSGAASWQDNTTDNPLFSAPSNGIGALTDGLDADWSLGAGSPCINTGSTDTTGSGTLDAVGETRVAEGRIDMGALESGAVGAVRQVVARGLVDPFPGIPAVSTDLGGRLLKQNTPHAAKATLQASGHTGHLSVLR